MKIKAIELQQKFPAMQQLAQQNPDLAGQFNQHLSAAYEAAGLNTVFEKIGEYEEELKVIELRRQVKQLRAAADACEIDLQPVETDAEVPESLQGLFVKPAPQEPQESDAEASKPVKRTPDLKKAS